MNIKMKIIPSIISVAVLAMSTHQAHAAGTEADTSINNRATISYSVGGVSQTDINSSPTGNSDPNLCTGALPADGSSPPLAAVCATTFEVDKKVDLLVTAGSGVNVAPNASGAATSITFTVTNEGNSDETFDLSTTGTVTGDDFDTSSCSITSPSPATAVPINQDANVAVTVQCTIPDVDPTNANGNGIVINGNSSEVDLLASANVAAETTGAETAGTVDVVYADDAGTATDAPNGAVSGDATRNAKHSATNTYTISTADLSVQKESNVISDPFNLTSNPKRIPGATIEYIITVTNADGAADATSLVMSDVLPAEMTYVSCSTTGDATGTPTCSESGGTVSTSAFTLPGGTGGSSNTQTLTITATVN